MRIGIDLGGTKIEGVVLDSRGAVHSNCRIATPRGDYPATLKAVAGLVETLEAAVGVRCSVGIGIPGAISPATGLVKNANATWLIGRALDRDLSEQLARPVRVANDANCFAMSEATDGAGVGMPVVFGVILGTGVGGGIVINGTILNGAMAVAGEWGHTPLPWPEAGERPGPRCYCGRRGCIETYLSGPALALDYHCACGRDASPQQIVQAAAAGDRQAKAALARYRHRLGRSLAVIVNIIDPDCIVLGGGMSNIPGLCQQILPICQRFVFSDQMAAVLRPARFGDASGVRGAAWLWPPHRAEAYPDRSRSA